MVKYILSMKVDSVQGVSSLKFVNTKESSICLDVRNPVDTNDIREKIVIDYDGLETIMEPDDHHSKKKQKEKKKHHDKPCHFALKWSDGSRGSILVIQQTPPPPTEEGGNGSDGIEFSHIGDYVPILTLECEHVEPIAFYPLGTEFEVIDTSGTKHEAIDLSNNGTWTHYDLSSGTTSVTGFQSKIE